jgi:hypothetical protein
MAATDCRDALAAKRHQELLEALRDIARAIREAAEARDKALTAKGGADRDPE